MKNHWLGRKAARLKEAEEVSESKKYRTAISKFRRRLRKPGDCGCNEQHFSLSVRTKNTSHRHGFTTLGEMCSYIDMLANDINYYITFSVTGKCEPVNDNEIVLAIWENGQEAKECL